MGEYMPAAVCKRGHPQTSDISYGVVTKRCPQCGAAVLTACPICGTRIRGGYKSSEISVLGAYTPPDFCDECGAPMPWVSRQGRIFELENLLDDEALDPATELDVREQLQVLASGDLGEDEERKRWERVKKGAPGLWEKSGAKTILESVISATIRSQIGV